MKRWYMFHIDHVSMTDFSLVINSNRYLKRIIHFVEQKTQKLERSVTREVVSSQLRKDWEVSEFLGPL